jgi:hypothetical protein
MVVQAMFALFSSQAAEACLSSTGLAVYRVVALTHGQKW